MTDVTCRTFIERLDDLLEGRLTPADRRAAEEHVVSCAPCADLKSLAAGPAGAGAPPPDLVNTVLRLTSGPACGSARTRLCDHMDRLLAPVDDDLMRMHVAGCVPCGGLVAALARLATDLPSLAEIEPGARFMEGVLARTSRRAKLSGRLGARLAAIGRSLAHRPRIAWEGAYVGAIVLAILCGTPNAPFAGVPVKAIDLVRTAQTLPAGAVEVPRVRQEVRTRLTATKTRMENATHDLTASLERRATAAWQGLKEEVGTVWDRIASQGTNDTDENGGDR